MSMARSNFGLTLGIVEIPEHDEALRGSVRSFLAEALADMPPERRARSWMGYDAEFSRKLGKHGFIGVTLPAQYGGAGRSPFARFVIAEELLAAGAPVVAHWIADRQSGPLILRYGTEKQKQTYLPSICRGEMYFCIGMSEPDSGSDLASIRTRAERTQSGWRITGRKIWTTNAHRSHFMLALVRTSGLPADRQRGLSQFIIDLTLPGVEVRPIKDIAGDDHFSEVVLEDVEVGDEALIGNEGAGWEQVNAELAFERSGPERFLSAMTLFEEILNFARNSTITDDRFKELFGASISRLVVLRSLSMAVTAKLAEGQAPVLEAALIKDLGTTFEQDLAREVDAVLGLDPERAVPESLSRVLAYTAKMSPSFSMRGGTREILRGMIARGVGLR